MSLLSGPTLRPNSDPAEARKETARSLESMLLKQMLSASGAFKGGEMAGSSMNADLFAEAIADAVSKGGGLGLANVLERSLPGGEGNAKAPVGLPGALGMITPALSTESHITSGFGGRVDPLGSGEHQAHHGVDLAAPEGAPIHSIQDGVVVKAGARGGYGNAVEVQHGDGTSTLYAHASDVTVREGQQVRAGEVIAHVGHTGRATGDHLHFELRRNGQPVDPRGLKLYANRVDTPVKAQE